MKQLFLLLSLWSTTMAAAQLPASPCTSDTLYRQFDFWIGEWEVFSLNGKRAGDSRVELILDSCIILENWTSAQAGYAGKSFNTYNSTSRQWQQTWVDNRGGSTEYLEGRRIGNKMVFLTKPFPIAKDSMAIRRLSFYHLSANEVRQHGEISKDGGVSWTTEYDLNYRRKK